jgi:hypothetical protein
MRCGRLVCRVDEVVEQHEQGVAFTGVGCDKVVEKHLVLLADAVDAAHPLFQAYEGPGDVVVDQDVGGLEVDAFVACVGCDDDLELAAHEGKADSVSLRIVLAAGVHTGGVAGGSEPVGDPLSCVGVLGEHDRLLSVARGDAVLGEAAFDEPLPLRRLPCGLLDRGADLVDQGLDS